MKTLSEEEKTTLARNHYEGLLWRKMGRAVIEYLDWTGEARAEVHFYPIRERTHVVQYTKGMKLQEDSI